MFHWQEAHGQGRGCVQQLRATDFNAFNDPECCCPGQPLVTSRQRTSLATQVGEGQLEGHSHSRVTEWHGPRFFASHWRQSELSSILSLVSMHAHAHACTSLRLCALATAVGSCMVIVVVVVVVVVVGGVIVIVHVVVCCCCCCLRWCCH